MKKSLFTIVIALAFSFGVTAQEQNNNKPVTTNFSVNIDCQSCVEKITKELAFERGIRNLHFSIEEQTLAVTYRPNRITKETIAEKVKKLGYNVSEIKLEVPGKKKETTQ